MRENHQFVAGLLVGALAGAALILYLNGDKGKALLAEVKEGAGKVEEDLKTAFTEFDMAVNSLIEKGTSFLEELEQKASSNA